MHNVRRDDYRISALESVCRFRSVYVFSVLFGLLHLGACTASGGVASADPWEPVNRKVHAINTGIDRVTLKPVAKGYRKVIPAFAQRGVSNFFTNLRTPLVIINNLLQGKGRDALSDSGRLLLNSTVGLGGLLDPASSAGLEIHNEDFGQTLAVWGVPSGPFVTVPLLGPRTLRDALTIPLNLFTNPLYHYNNSSVRDKLWLLYAIQLRSRLLLAENIIKDSPDPYLTIRESYLQRRQYLIHDGDPPDDYEFFEASLDEKR